MPVRGGEGGNLKLTPKQKRDRAARIAARNRPPPRPLPLETVAPGLAAATQTKEQHRQEVRDRHTVERAIAHGLTPQQRGAALARTGFRGASALEQALAAEHLNRIARMSTTQARPLTPAQAAVQRALPPLSRQQQLDTAAAIALQQLSPLTRQAYRPSAALTAALSLGTSLVPFANRRATPGLGQQVYVPGEGYHQATIGEATVPMEVPWPSPVGKAAEAALAVERAAGRALEGPIAPEATGPWGNLVRRPGPPTRVFRGPMGQSVEVPAAGSRIGRLGERTLDVARPRLSPLTGGLVRTEEAKFFKAKGLNERMVTRKMNVQSRVLQRLSRRWGGFRKMTVGEAYALQAYATNTSPELWAQAADRWAAEAEAAGNRAGRIFNEQHADYYRRAGAGPYLDLAGPDVQFAATPEGQKLERMYAEMEKAIGTREQIGRDLGQLTDEKVASGISAPGRIARGARWVEPTPGRQGVSPAAERATRHRARLEKAVASAEARATKAETVTRARTPEEARARLDELDKRYDRLVDANARRMGLLTPEGKMSADQIAEAQRRGKLSAKAARQQAGRTRAGGVSGAVSGKKVTAPQPLSREIYQQAEDDLFKTAEAEPGASGTRKFLDWAAERDALRNQLENPETMFEGGPARGELGTVTEERLPFDKYARKQLAGRKVLTAEQQAARQEAAVTIREALRPMEKEFRRLQAEWTDPARPEFEERAGLNRLLRAGNEAQDKIAAYAEKAGIPPEFMPSIAQIEARVEELTAHIDEIRGPSSDALRTLRKDISKARADLRRLERATPVMVGERVLTPEGRLLQPKGYQRLQHLRAQLSGAKTREQQLEQARLNRIEPTGLVGAEDFVSGRLYTHTQPGAPGLRARVYASYRERMPRARGTKLSNNPRHDPRMRRAMTGALLRSGRYTVDPLGSTAQALETATRMDHYTRALKVVQDSATPAPRSVFDQIVVLDPERFAEAYPESYSASKQAQAVRNVYQELDLLASTDKAKFRREMLDVDPRMIDQLRDAIFPTDAGHLLEVGRPVPGAGFVNPGAVNEMGIFHLPVNQKGWATAFQRFSNYTAVNLSDVWLLRALNTISRWGVLYLNPAYITVNLAGNGLLNLFQQGIFLPRNLVATAHASLTMSPRAVGTLDAYMGEGLTGSTGPASKVADIISAFVDRIPRRMSFVHEARRQGYKTTQDLERLLLGDSPDVHLIRQRAVDAIVDYERLSPFERSVAKNLLAFYPWTKGAIHYSIRFPLEHPYQALAVAAVGYWQDEQADKVLGDNRPAWMQFALPVATGADGRPIVVNLQSLTPFTTPVQLGEQLYGAATGNPQWGNLIGLAGPGPAAILEAATGTTGIGTGAPYGAPGAAGSLFQMAAPIRLAERGSLKKALLGSLSPESYSWAGKKKRDKLISDSNSVGLGDPPEEVMNELEARGRLDEAVRSQSTDVGKFTAAAKVYEAITGDDHYVRRAEHGVSERVAGHLYQHIRDRLTRRVKHWERRVDHRKEHALR